MHHVDTETLYSVAFNSVTQEYGKTYTWEHKANVMGFKTSVALQAIIDMLQLPITVQTFEDKLVPIYQKLFPKSQLLPGILHLTLWIDISADIGIMNTAHRCREASTTS